MVTLLVSLLLSAAQAAPPATAATPAAAASDEGSRIKCRKIPVTGSLARFTRECRTVAEWDKLDEGHREDATKIQERGHVVSCGSAAQGC